MFVNHKSACQQGDNRGDDDIMEIDVAGGKALRLPVIEKKGHEEGGQRIDRRRDDGTERYNMGKTGK